MFEQDANWTIRKRNGGERVAVKILFSNETEVLFDNGCAKTKRDLLANNCSHFCFRFVGE